MYIYHPVHVFFRHQETLSLFNNLLMLQQTKLFFVLFYKIWLNWLETLSAVRLPNAQSIFTNNDKRSLLTFASKTLLLGNLHIKGHSWHLGRTDQGYRRSQKRCRMNFQKGSKPQLTPTPQNGPYLWKACACISYYPAIIPPCIYSTISKHLKGHLDPPVGNGHVFWTKGGQLDPPVGWEHHKSVSWPDDPI